MNTKVKIGIIILGICFVSGLVVFCVFRGNNLNPDALLAQKTLRDAVTQAKQGNRDNITEEEKGLSPFSSAQREWEKRINIPDDYKEYESLRKYLSEQYYKGVGTREEMVKKYEALAEKYPDSPLAVNTLYDASLLYTSGTIRGNYTETYLPDKAREYYEQIIAKNPDLLSEFFIWSRGNLADLCPTADQRLKSQIELYNWLKNVKPEQYKSTIEFMKKDYRYRNRSAKILEEQINALIKTTNDTLQKNMLSNAKASSNPDENLTIVNKLLSSE